MLKLLQQLVLATQVPPFTWAYERAYQKAIHFVAGRLRRLHGVRAVYLVSGFLDQPIYGLSDIDLAVIVDDTDGRSLSRVRDHYAQLADYIPLLDSADDPGLFATDNLAAVFARRPIVQYRLGPHRPKKLLAGEDLLANVPITSPRSDHALAEISLWWEFLARTRKNDGTSVETSNVARKLLADVYRAILWDREGVYVARRSDVLERLRGDRELVAKLDPELVERTRQPLDATGPPVAHHRLFTAFHTLVADYLRGGPTAEVGGALVTDRATWTAFAESAGEPLAALRARFGDAVVPVPNFWVRPEIDEDHHATIRRVHLRLGRLPSDEELAFIDAVQARAPGCELFLELDGVSYPVGRARLHGVTAKRRTPELFPDVSGAGTEISVPISTPRLAKLREVFAERDALSARAVGAPTLWKANAHRLVEQLLTSGEARQAVRATGDRLEIATAPAQLLRMWPDASTAERETLELAARLLAGPGKVSDATLPVPALHAVVATLSRLHGTTPPGPAAPPTKLTMSVVIITRNRADLLKKAISSLIAQRRQPDELVVVDNGSSDHTREVVESFAADLPVVYRHLAEPSIPKARNLGARTASKEIICFVDDDEIVEPQWLEQAERSFLRDPQIGIVGGENVNVASQQNLIADFFREYMRA